MVTGYVRVSTDEQTLDMQIDALEKARCQKIYQEKISSTKANRPALEDLIDKLRKGDTLVVWKQIV